MKARRPAGGAARRAATILGPVLAAALVAGLVSFAATGPAAAATRWYRVEVVLFAQGGDADWRRNDWREEGPPTLAKNTVELLPGLDAAGLPTGSNRRHAFRTLPASALDLGAVANRLDRSNDYRVLLHAGWNQPGFSDDEAPAVRLSTLGALAAAQERSAGANGEEVEGAVRFWRRRFLHVDVDLSFGDIEAWREQEEGSVLATKTGDFPALAATRPGGESAVSALAMAGARTGTPGLPAEGSTGRARGGAAEGEKPETDARRVAGVDERLRVVRLTRSLRLRSGRLHYIDHPLFGVLLVVRRLD